MNATLLIVSIFLLTCLASGLYAGRNTKNFKQFAIGDKDFSPFTIIATMVATCLGRGLFFNDLELVYVHGLYVGLPILSIGLGYLFISRYMVWRLGEFIGHYSIAESMGSMFCPAVRTITALSGILLLTGTASFQLNVMARALNICCDINSQVALHMAVVVILVYTTFGGIKAVTFTDVIQFVTFAALVPLFLFLVSHHMPNGRSITSILATHPNFDLRQVVGLHRQFIDTLPLILLYSFPLLDPASMQRLYMAKHVWEVGSAFKCTAYIGLISKIFIIVLALTLLTHNAPINPKKIADFILEMESHAWLKAIFCISVLALAMSTADSHLHSATVLLTHDLTAAYGWKPKNKLLVARLSSIGVTLLAFCFALEQKNFFNQLMLSLSFYVPIVNPPLVLAIFGFRPPPRSVLLGMAAGGMAMVGFKIGWFDCLGIKYPTFPAMLVNLFFLMGSHYLLPRVAGRGWITTKSQKKLIRSEKSCKETNTQK